MNERDAWIALAATPGVGDHTFSRLLEQHGSAAGTLEAVCRLRERSADRTIADWSGTRPRAGLTRAIRRSAEDPARVQREVQSLGGWVLTPFDEAYPGGLSAIEEPPPVLYGLTHNGLRQIELWILPTFLLFAWACVRSNAFSRVRTRRRVLRPAM